jgi:hypothetical protein
VAANQPALVHGNSRSIDKFDVRKVHDVLIELGFGHAETLRIWPRSCPVSWSLSNWCGSDLSLRLLKHTIVSLCVHGGLVSLESLAMLGGNVRGGNVRALSGPVMVMIKPHRPSSHVLRTRRDHASTIVTDARANRNNAAVLVSEIVKVVEDTQDGCVFVDLRRLWDQSNVHCPGRRQRGPSHC